MLLLAALKVLVLAGGVDAARNHHSHKVHVDRLVALLEARGVPAQDVAVFWADGVDEKPDRSVRSQKWPKGWWLAAGTPIGDEIEPDDEHLDTRFDRPVFPASRDALRTWLTSNGPTFTADDTLLIAVTDHGEPDPTGDLDTAINLWGEDTWSTKELLADLAPVPEHTRIVLWMSQCYSGGFASLFRHRDNLCGAFSAHFDREAYGCYSDLARKDDIGHFHRFISAFERHTDLASAHDEVLVRDDTPDTPHLTSDALLYDALTAYAEQSGTPADLVIDARVHAAPADHPNRALIAQISTQYGLGVINGYGAAMILVDQLNRAQFALDAWRDRWKRADVARRSAFIERPGKPFRKAPPTRAGKIKAQARLAKAALATFDALPDDAQARIRNLRNRKRSSSRIARRAELQIAATYRVADLYARMTVPAILDRETERAYAALKTCESTPLLPPPVERPEPEKQGPTPLLASRVPSDVEGLRPGYLGVAYRDLPGYRGVAVKSLWPASPAAASGLQIGDELLEMNGEPIRGKGDFAERIALSRPGGWVEFVGRRKGKPLKEKVRVAGMPLPSAPPGIGQPLPPLKLEPYDAVRPLPTIGEGHAALLFVWATWCKPCKRAIPELKAYAAEHGVPIIAITDEERHVVRRFLSKAKDFDFQIALDPLREATRLIEDRKRPAFALIGPGRRLLQLEIGFEDRLLIDPPPAR